MKTGLKTVINKFIILLFFVLNINLSAQIPVNGFLKYNSYKTVPGCKSILTLNYNNDSYTDLLLFNNATRNAYLLEGDGFGGFSKTTPVRFKDPPSGIRNLSFEKIFSRLYLAVSRKGRSASILSFTKEGKLLTLDEKRFSSYPEITDVSDIDLNQSPDVLVTGPAFDGVSILQIKNGKISERKVIKENAFRDAVFADFNNDGFSDIVAANLFSGAIDFYRNISRGAYRYERSFFPEGIPFTLNSIDIDIDFFEDIIWSEKKKISIMYGDAISAYDNKINLITEYNPHMLVTGDYNSDGNVDIAYTDTLEGIVSVLFGNDKRRFSEEFVLFRKNVSALTSFYSKFITGIAALDVNGYIYTVTRIGSFSEDVSIAAGIKPGVLSVFDYLNDGLNDLCFIDEERAIINFLVRNNEGLPHRLYQSKLHFPHREIITDDYSKEVKVFYCWTSGEKLIEIITADFGKNEFKKQALYASGRIQELKLKRQKGEPAIIFASYENGRSAGANVFEFHNFRYINADYRDFAADVVKISPFIRKNESGFLVWQKRDKLILSLYNINKFTSKRIGRLDLYDTIIPVTGDILNDGQESQIAYLKRNNKKMFALAKNRINTIPVSDSVNIENGNQLWLGPVRPGGLNKLWVYLPDKKSLNLITLFNRGKDLILTEKISGININRFFIRNISIQGFHVIYSDPEENCVTIKRLE